MFPLPENNHWHEEIKIISCCPLCQSTNKNIEARIVGQDGQTKLLHLNCLKCSNSLLALVLVSAGGVSSIGMLTDLTFEDTVRFKQTRMVRVDDVLAVHKELDQEDFLQRI